jgi:hypothetical protein
MRERVGQSFSCLWVSGGAGIGTARQPCGRASQSRRRTTTPKRMASTIPWGLVPERTGQGRACPMEGVFGDGLHSVARGRGCDRRISANKQPGLNTSTPSGAAWRARLPSWCCSRRGLPVVLGSWGGAGGAWCCASGSNGEGPWWVAWRVHGGMDGWEALNSIFNSMDARWMHVLALSPAIRHPTPQGHREKADKEVRRRAPTAETPRPSQPCLLSGSIGQGR